MGAIVVRGVAVWAFFSAAPAIGLNSIDVVTTPKAISVIR
jgi:hypothetical protein